MIFPFVIKLHPFFSSRFYYLTKLLKVVVGTHKLIVVCDQWFGDAQSMIDYSFGLLLTNQICQIRTIKQMLNILKSLCHFA
ncbi:hypothetical protein NIES3585_07440 [Nodularia sp. NIES-3585]|nr:hypothetical protein NIES3585_07440 [Nodularia sp. NIES-3585]